MITQLTSHQVINNNFVFIFLSKIFHTYRRYHFVIVNFARRTLKQFQLIHAGLQSVPKQDHPGNIYSCFSAHHSTAIKLTDIFYRI